MYIYESIIFSYNVDIKNNKLLYSTFYGKDFLYTRYFTCIILLLKITH